MVTLSVVMFHRKNFSNDLSSFVGSETNTVHLYQREISRPLLSYKFDEGNNGTAKSSTTTNANPDRVKKEETGTEFVSAMCWSNVS